MNIMLSADFSIPIDGAGILPTRRREDRERQTLPEEDVISGALVTDQYEGLQSFCFWFLNPGLEMAPARIPSNRIIIYSDEDHITQRPRARKGEGDVLDSGYLQLV